MAHLKVNIKYRDIQLLLCLFLTFACAQVSSGENKKIEFDPPVIVKCKDVTPEKFASENPESKLVEVRLSISAVSSGIGNDEIGSIKYELFDESKKSKVVDFGPSNKLADVIEGNIEIIEGQNAGANMGVNVGYGISKTEASASVNSNQQKTYNKLPPKELLVGSGTTKRQRGVFYKLKQTPRTTLEGQQNFIIILLVPKNWRGGVQSFTANAVAAGAGMSEDFQTHIALVIERDRDAMKIARKFEAAFDSLMEAEEQVKKSIAQASNEKGVGATDALIAAGGISLAGSGLGGPVIVAAVPAWLGYKYFYEEVPPEEKNNPQVLASFEDPRYKKAGEEYEKAKADLEALSGSH